ncbi:MAG: nodulation protein NfeD [Gammaproteobacteria bacterium]|nr:nodulation protein NfeD [Gammaproteobacteria bacterium]
MLGWLQGLNHCWARTALLLLGICASSSIMAAVEEAVYPHVAELSIRGPIGPATTDYLERAAAEAEAQGARLLILKLDTPGGLDAATRDIIQWILASNIPVASYVHPAGARAASAGTYILYASHIAAMTPSTTLGAATPVQMGGFPGGEKATPKDESSNKKPAEDATNDQDKTTNENEKKTTTDKPANAPQASDNTMQRKVVNDAVAFIRGLAKRRGRNAEWAEKAVREAATLTAQEALEQHVIDIVASDEQDLLTQAAGREVSMQSNNATIDVNIAELPIIEYQPDWRNQLLALITNPQVAYILLLVGIYGLIFEGYSPGAMVPGIVGVICLLLAFYALQVLPINYAGLALIIVGALLIVAELFMPSFGALGIGGVIALVIGSVMLIDSDVPGMQISRGLIGAIAGISGLGFLGLMFAVGHSLRKPRIDSTQAMVGRKGLVLSVEADEIQIRINGELWHAECQELLRPGQTVEVVAEQGLLLQVKPS